MENYFRVNFKAQLVKFVLAFKADCQIDIFWKKGTPFPIQARRLRSHPKSPSMPSHTSTRNSVSAAIWSMICRLRPSKRNWYVIPDKDQVRNHPLY